MRGNPDRGLYDIVAGPRFVGQHVAGASVGKVVVKRGDRRPDERLDHAAADVVPVVKPRDVHGATPVTRLRAILARPQPLAGYLGKLRAAALGIMHTDHAERAVEFGVFRYNFRHLPFRTVVLVGRDIDDVFETVGIERAAEQFHPLLVPWHLVPYTGVGDVDIMDPIRYLDELHHAVRHVLRIEISTTDPAGSTPGETIEDDVHPNRRPCCILHTPPVV